jgi:hypothetical protein
VGERASSGEIADRPDAVAGPLVLVDVQPAGGGIQADGVQPEGGQVRAPSGRDQQPLAGELVAVQVTALVAGQGHGEPALVVPDGLRARSRPDGQALAGQDVGQ